MRASMRSHSSVSPRSKNMPSLVRALLTSLPPVSPTTVSEAWQTLAGVGAIDARGRDELDVSGRLVSPPFVDCHFHMDATLSLGLPRLNRSGTLLEGIQLWNDVPTSTDPLNAANLLAYRRTL